MRGLRGAQRAEGHASCLTRGSPRLLAPRQVDRFLKRANKEPRLREVVQGLAAAAEVAVRQNNTIDAYEHYFADYSLGEARGGGALHAQQWRRSLTVGPPGPPPPPPPPRTPPPRPVL